MMSYYIFFKHLIEFNYIANLTLRARLQIVIYGLLYGDFVYTILSYDTPLKIQIPFIGFIILLVYFSNLLCYFLFKL